MSELFENGPPEAQPQARPARSGREVQAGEACPECGAALELVRCIEAGHIFKLGRSYAESMGVSVLDADGKAVTPIMGSYGIGIGRGVATIAETHYDDKGLVWPMSVAPYEVVVTSMSMKDEAVVSTSEDLYQELRRRGVEVIIDDRDARAGVKFADAELIGIPLRVTVGPRGLERGAVEITPRATGESEDCSVAEAAERIHGLVLDAR